MEAEKDETLLDSQGKKTEVASSTSSPNFLVALPPELHLLITSYLTYPDALSLKHTNRYFYVTVDTDIDLKIEWLIERRRLHLDCPHDRACELGSDQRFCRGSVMLLMKRRREHFECETSERPGGRGCLVYGTRICVHKRVPSKLAIMRDWVGGNLWGNFVFWWAVVATLGLVLALAGSRVWGMEAVIGSEL